MVSTALQFEAVVVACAPSRGTSSDQLETFGIVYAHRYRTGIPMLGKLTNLPIDTLLDIVFVIFAGGQPLTCLKYVTWSRFNSSCNAEANLRVRVCARRRSGWATFDSSNLTRL